MKKLIVILALLMTGCAATPYIKAGIGYEIHQTETRGISCDSRILGRVEAGFLFDGYIAGIGHTSHPTCGWPVNKRAEIATDQIFIDKIWAF